MTKLLLTIPLVAIGCFVDAVRGQANTNEVTVVESHGGSNCELVSATVDTFFQSLKAPKSIILVSYKGRDEGRKGVDLQRLRTANRYIRAFFPSGSRTPVISAVSDDLATKGKLDFYIDGAVTFRIEFSHNSYLALSSCYGETRPQKQSALESLSKKMRRGHPFNKA